MFHFLKEIASAFLARVTSADLTTLAELMKEVYDPVIQEQQNLEPTTWRDFGEANDQLGGDGWFFETKMGGNQEGIGARAERADLPTAGSQRWKQGKVYPKFIYGTFEITGPAIAAARDNLRAFANSKTEEMQGLTRDVTKDLNRQVFGDGLGELAVLNGVEPAAFKVQTNNGQYLRLNMLIDFWDSTGTGAITKHGEARQITALVANADGTMTITYDGSDLNATLAANDVITRHDAAGETGAKAALELTGYKAIADDGTAAATYLNIARASYPLWNGVLLDNSGTTRNLTLDLMQQAEDAIWRNTNEKPDWIRMNLGQRRKFFDLVAPDKRYMSGTIDGGYQTLLYNGIVLTIDHDMPRGEILFCVKKYTKKYEMQKFGLLTFDGLALRQVVNKDLWRGHIGLYGELGCKRPNANCRLTDLVEPDAPQYVG